MLANAASRKTCCQNVHTGSANAHGHTPTTAMCTHPKHWAVRTPQAQVMHRACRPPRKCATLARKKRTCMGRFDSEGIRTPCGQSPMDFESIFLAARTQCLAEQALFMFTQAHQSHHVCVRVPPLPPPENPATRSAGIGIIFGRQLKNK